MNALLEKKQSVFQQVRFTEFSNIKLVLAMKSLSLFSLESEKHLAPKDQLFLVLMRLRLNFGFKHLAQLFKLRYDQMAVEYSSEGGWVLSVWQHSNLAT